MSDDTGVFRALADPTRRQILEDLRPGELTAGEIAALPAVEVHLSNIDEREPWRSVSVIRDLVLACVSGQGVEGYREALVRLSKELDG